MRAKQMQIISLDLLVPENHTYRKFIELWDFRKIDKVLLAIQKDNPNEGYTLPRLFKCLILQFLEDLSDRQLEKLLQENNAAKWFCDFSLKDKTPDHTVFTRCRKRIGTHNLSKLFTKLRNQLKAKGYMNEVFTFVDSSHLISKSDVWQERDEAIKKNFTKLNNETLPKVAKDPQARFGCKRKNKFWYGYKKHVSVDMQSGLINKVAVTFANIMDDKGMKNVCPSQGGVYADKAYCTKYAKKVTVIKGCHLAAIMKNNMKDKNKEKDKWYSKLRAPYERFFSKTNKRVRYKGIAKNQFSEFMKAICFNLKRMVVLSDV